MISGERSTLATKLSGESTLFLCGCLRPYRDLLSRGPGTASRKERRGWTRCGDSEILELGECGWPCATHCSSTWRQPLPALVEGSRYSGLAECDDGCAIRLLDDGKDHQGAIRSLGRQRRPLPRGLHAKIRLRTIRSHVDGAGPAGLAVWSTASALPWRPEQLGAARKYG